MVRRRMPGLWVMEGKWSASVKDVRSVDPVLHALAQDRRAHHAKEHINDPDDVVRSFKRWAQKQHDSFNIGYLALHGSPGAVHVGRKAVDLHELAEQLPKGGLAKKALHFGSCSVLDVSRREQEELRAALGVRVITGFKKDVEWFESLAFELLLFEALTAYVRPAYAYNYLMKTHSAFARRLGFVMVRG